MKVLNKEQTRFAEQAAEIDGISSERLMENAGSAATRVIKEQFKTENKKVLVVAGSGNNAGDGFVVARKLAEYGAKVIVMLVMGSPATKNSSIMLSRLQNHEIRVVNYYEDKQYSEQIIRDCDIIIDAIFGIGFHGAPDRDVAHIIETINQLQAIKISLDVPSGVCCDDGVVNGAAVKADITISFIGYKPCNFIYPGADYCGETISVSIGISDELIINYSAKICSVKAALKTLKPIPKNANKGTKGTAAIVAGSYGMAGAACFAASSAMRAGAGIVRLCVPKSIYAIAATIVPEAVFQPADDENGYITPENLDIEKLLCGAKSVLAGPGMGDNIKTAKTVEKILELSTVPVVIDADGLNAIAKHIEILGGEHKTVIVTPHPGEMSRLTCKTIEEIEKNRISAASDFSRQYNVITLLKGAYTVIASPDGRININTTGNECMATAGSGDMLSGILSAFLANGMEPFAATVAAACLHGAAGDITAQKIGKRGVIVSDMINNLPDVFNLK